MSLPALFDLSGKVALVTGGSRGLGLQMAEGLGEAGATVAITARKQDELDAAVAHLDGLGMTARAYRCDLADPGAIPPLVDALVADLGTVDVLVNNAGTNWGAAAEDYPAAAWHKVIDLNLNATWALTQEIGRRIMIPRRSGKIISIASVAGLAGNPPRWNMHTVAYNVSKGGVVSLTRSLASEWGRYNINVNVICPGFFRSKMTDAFLDRTEPLIIEDTALGRLGGAEDLKGTVVFFAAEASRHVTGQFLVVDGGTTVG
ncbi:MAG: SDR family oxidoreductase [Gammaproteobacteria bacterium]|nr:SDR family oxidoreductase [Gammaproteobacteria bacterium]